MPDLITLTATCPPSAARVGLRQVDELRGAQRTHLPRTLLAAARCGPFEQRSLEVSASAFRVRVVRFGPRVFILWSPFRRFHPRRCAPGRAASMTARAIAKFLCALGAGVPMLILCEIARAHG